MPSRRDARVRHARRFLVELREIEATFNQGGPRAENAATQFSCAWAQIQGAQNWAAKELTDDDVAASLCSEFAGVCTTTGQSILDIRRHPRERIAWLEVGLKAARRLRDHPAEGLHLHHLGLVLLELHDRERAMHCLARARAIFHRLEERICEGTTCTAIGTALQSEGKPKRALTYFRKALALYREAPSKSHEAFGLECIGSLYRSMGENKLAIEHLQKALAIARRSGNRNQEHAMLNSLGAVYLGIGDLGRAKNTYSRAAAIAHEAGDWAPRGFYSSELTGIGLSEASAGNVQGIVTIRRELEAYRSVGNRLGEGFTLIALGLAFRTLRMRPDAAKAYEDSLLVFRDVGHPIGEGTALQGLGLVTEEQGNAHLAIAHYMQALAVFRLIDHRRGEAAVLFDLSFAMVGSGQRRDGIRSAKASLQIYEEIGHPSAEKVRSQVTKWLQRE